MFSHKRNGNGNGAALLGAAAGIGGALALAAAARHFGGMDLRGKVVLITGGSRGLGLVLAREFADEGCRLAICARDEQELCRAQAELTDRGADVLAIQCDLRQRVQVEEMILGVTGHFGGIDVLVNNAGVIQVGPMNVMTLEDYEEAMDVHFWAPVWATLAALPSMRSRGEGRVVNISSIGGKLSPPHLLPYNASKFALTGFSEGLRAELAGKGIKVTTVCPGLMRTGSPKNAYFKGQHRAEYAWFSISDSLPGLSMSARRAARKIVNAARRGDAELVLTLPARLAVAFHGLFPGTTANMMGLVNRFLPGPGGIGTMRARGYESESSLSPSMLTALTERAAVANNEL